MSDELQMLDETVRAILAEGFGREVRTKVGFGFPTGVWSLLDRAGLTTLGAVENEVGLAELAVLAKAVGRAAVPIPLIETAGLAAWLVTSAGLELPDGLVTCASSNQEDHLQANRIGDHWVIDGVLHRVPWARNADAVTAIADGPDGALVVVLPIPAEVEQSTNLAGEPRDTLRFTEQATPDSLVGATTVSHRDVKSRGAVLRSAAMAGAMETISQLTVEYAAERHQFGKPISSFQAVQHHLVAVAGESMCTAMAVNLAAAASPGQLPFAAAAAKSAAGASARIVARRAHQVFAAIGVTQESSLPWFTTRLWAWEDEFGTTGFWDIELGRQVITDGGAALWPTISQSIGAPTTAGST